VQPLGLWFRYLTVSYTMRAYKVTQRVQFGA